LNFEEETKSSIYYAYHKIFNANTKMTGYSTYKVWLLNNKTARAAADLER